METEFEKRVNRYMQCEKRTLAELLALLDEKVGEECKKNERETNKLQYFPPQIKPYTSPSILPLIDYGWTTTCSKDENYNEAQEKITLKRRRD